MARTDGESRGRVERTERVECYYIENAVESMQRPSLLPFREHLVQSMQTMKFLQLNAHKKPSLKELEKHFIQLPPSKCTLQITQSSTR